MDYEDLKEKIYLELNLNHAKTFLMSSPDHFDIHSLKKNLDPIPLPAKIAHFSIAKNSKLDSIKTGVIACHSLISTIDSKYKNNNNEESKDTFLEKLLSNKIIANSEKMSDVGRYASITRKWQRWLIEEITDIALFEIEKSRTNVKNWQLSVFGRSLSNNDLNRYADRSRGAGYKVKKIDSSDYVSQNAKKMYMEYKNILEEVSKAYGIALPASVGSYLYLKNKNSHHHEAIKELDKKISTNV